MKPIIQKKQGDRGVEVKKNVRSKESGGRVEWELKRQRGRRKQWAVLTHFP